MTNNEKRATELVQEFAEGSVNGIHSEDAKTLAEEITEALNAAQSEGYKQGAESKWLPIEGAPKNENVLVAVEGCGFSVMAISEGEAKDGYVIWNTYGCGSILHGRKITHWTPMPPAPKGEE